MIDRGGGAAAERAGEIGPRASNSGRARAARGPRIRWRVVRRSALVFALCALLPTAAGAAELPPHGPLRILIVSDEVNPNGLSDAELTQPGDLSAAIGDPASGLSLVPGPEGVREVSSQCVDEALSALAAPGSVDVLIYFAHRAALGCDASDRQAELTGAVADLLASGGGVVVFHHGIYEAAGKQPILQLLGGSASAIEWSVNAGQRVIDVAPGHFVTTQSVEYSGTTMYADPQSGVAAGTYDSFLNKPDERYPALALLTAPGEARQILFASDYATGGNAHVLGYDLTRPGWSGRVVFYQPGEYQPQALDDLAGNNFQILANAIVHVAPAGGAETSSGGETSGSTGETGSGGSTTGGPGATGGPGSTGSPGSTGEPGGSEATGGEVTTSAAATSSAGGGSSGGTSAGTAGSAATAGDPQESGCACRSGTGPPALAAWALILAGLRRRRR